MKGFGAVATGLMFLFLHQCAEGQESSRARKNTAFDQVSEFELASFRDAAEYSRSAHGVSLLIMRGGNVLFEDTLPAWKDRPHQLASGTKSFSGLMAVCAVQDGLLTLDERVADTLTEWKRDPRKSAITIRQLLSLSGGIRGGQIGMPPAYQDAVAMADSFAQPGRSFSYGPIPYQCFGELMKRKLAAGGESVEQYLNRRIIEPIGLEVGFWRKDKDGNINLPSGAYLTALQWAKFGELVRCEGKWQGNSIVSAELVEECFRPAAAKSNYGMTFWLLGRDSDTGDSDTGDSDTGDSDSAITGGRVRRMIVQRNQHAFQPPKDTVAAMGKGKQRCYIIPSMELVVVRLGDSVGSEFNDNVFLGKLLGNPPRPER